MQQWDGGEVRGACPTVHRPFPAVDGGLVRVRLPGGLLPAAGALELAGAAQRWGSGVIEITNRANVQLRGVRRPGALAAALVAAGLAWPEPEPDGLRDVTASPLAGLDPDEQLDPLPLVTALERCLRPLSGLEVPPKFGMLIEGGGAVGLAGLPRDLCLAAVGPGRLELVLGRALPAERPAGEAAVLVDAEGAGEVAAAAARLCARSGRMATLDPNEALAGIARESGRRLERAPRPRTLRSGALRPVGILAQRQPGLSAVGAVAPLRRLRAETLAAIAGLGQELRLTPWGGVVVAGVPAAAAAETRRRLEALGLACDPADPAAAVIACAGSTGCAAGEADVQAAAARLVERLRAAGIRDRSVHLTGCPKSCASRRQADVTLLARPGGRYDAFVRSAADAGFGRQIAADLDLDAALRLAAG